MKRQKFSLGFRNASSQKHLEICDGVLGQLASLTEAGRKDIDLPGLNAAVATAHASRQRIQMLRADLKQEIASHKTHLRAAREQMTLASWAVMTNVQGDPQAMRTAGLPLKSPWRKVGVPGAPLNLTARPTVLAGEIQLRWKRTVRRCLFHVEFTTNPLNEKNWRAAGGNRQQTFTVPELVAGKLYWFRVRAENIHGLSPWSNVATARAM